MFAEVAHRAFSTHVAPLGDGNCKFSRRRVEEAKTVVIAAPNRRDVPFHARPFFTSWVSGVYCTAGRMAFVYMLLTSVPKS